MDEYPPDEIKEEEVKEGLEYKIVGVYTINIPNRPYEIETITHPGLKEVGWTKVLGVGSMHTQNVNLKNLKNNNKSKKVMCKIIQEVYKIQTGKKVKLGLILENHKTLVENMLTDYITYYKNESKK